ncbi:MAG: SpoIIE family protein phosphatase, partial [Lachnospiraceae bacterium]|nr:SpoIIE family protein phosphatase [Lachnospiraceae bacterium]
QRFGTDQMLSVLNHHKDASPEELLENIKGEVDRFTGEGESFDDITLMSFVWHGLE